MNFILYAERCAIHDEVLYGGLLPVVYVHMYTQQRCVTHYPCMHVYTFPILLGMYAMCQHK